MSATMASSRQARLSTLSMAVADRARQIASGGDTLRAMRVLALAEALHHAAGGDLQGRKLAMSDARTYRRAIRRLRDSAA